MVPGEEKSTARRGGRGAEGRCCYERGVDTAGVREVEERDSWCWRNGGRKEDVQRRRSRLCCCCGGTKGASTFYPAVVGGKEEDNANERAPTLEGI